MNDHRRIRLPEGESDAPVETRRNELPPSAPPARPLEMWLVFALVALSWFAAGAVWMDKYR